MGYDAVVLAGGASKRMGVDKLDLDFGGRTILQRVIEACEGAEQIIAVGPERPSVAADWVLEEPRGGGPAAAVSAGMSEVRESITLVVAGDLPLLRREDVTALIDAIDKDGAVAIDEHGHRQYLAGAYRTDILRYRLKTFPRITGVSMRAVLDGLDLIEVPAVTWSRDVDVPSDVDELLGKRPRSR